MYNQVWRRRDNETGYPTTNHVSIKLITPPVAEPVTLKQLKLQARYFSGEADEILALYLTAAREMIEKFLRRTLVTQTWDFRCDWGPAWVELPYPNLQSVIGVYTTGLDNVETTVPTSTYIVDQEHNMVALNIGAVWPLHRGKAGFRIQYTSGYGTMPLTPNAPNPVPATIRRYILALAATMDDKRTDVFLTEDMQAGLAPYRIYGEPYRMARGANREDILG